MIERFVRVLHKGDIHALAPDILDMLWLAQYLPAGLSLSKPERLEPDPSPVEPGKPESPQGPSVPKIPPTEDSSSPGVPVHTPPQPAGPASCSSQPGLPFASPAAEALPGKRDMERALRPLMHRVASQTDIEIDEDTTAQQMAECTLGQQDQAEAWMLALRPVPARRFDLALIVDESSSMDVWWRTVDEWQRLLAYLGAFRQVQTWGFDERNGEVHLHHRVGFRQCDPVSHDPKELAALPGQRLFLVVSDCVSPMWYDGRAVRMLKPWARCGLVSILQTLPPGIWSRTALGEALHVRLQAHSPTLALTQAQWNVDPSWAWFGERELESLAVPIVSFDPSMLRSWARAVTGMSNGGIYGKLFIDDNEPPDSDYVEGDNLSVEDQVRRFAALVSPTARQLAGYLAAAPLNLHVMRLVQRTVPFDSQQHHLAEVLMGGLLRRKPLPEPMTDPDDIEYEFVDGEIPNWLLGYTLKSIVIQVLMQVSEYINERAGGSSNNFRAWLEDPQSEQPNFDEQSAPFAHIMARTLRRMGGRYARMAQDIEKNLKPERQAPKDTKVREKLSQVDKCLNQKPPNLSQARQLLEEIKDSAGQEYRDEITRLNRKIDVLEQIDRRLADPGYDKQAIDSLVQQLHQLDSQPFDPGYWVERIRSKEIMNEAIKRAQEHIGRAKECLQNNDLRTVREYLDEVERSVLDEATTKEWGILDRQVAQRLQAQVDRLELAVQAALNADPFDEEDANRLLGEWSELASGNDRLAFWQQQVQQRVDNRRAAVYVQQVQCQVDEQLQQAAHLWQEGTDPQLVLEAYQQAVDLVQSGLNSYPGHNELQLLQARVERERNKFRAESDIVTTVAATGEFRAALQMLEQYESPDQVVPVFEGMQSVGQMSVAEARRFYIRQAAIWTQRKTPDKIRDARHALTELHAPEAAKEILETFKVQLGDLMPDPERNAIDEVLRQEIEPACERRRRAEQLREQAKNAPHGQIVQAWKTLQQARQADAFTPELEQVQKMLSQRLDNYIRARLADAERELNSKNHAQALDNLKKAQEALALDASPPDLSRQYNVLDKRLQQEQNQAQDVTNTLARIREIIKNNKDDEEKIEQARQAWDNLEQRLGPDVIHYPQIAEVGKDLDKSLNVVAVLALAEKLIKGYDIQALGEILPELKTATAKYPDRKNDLRRCQERVLARRAFLEAEIEIESGSLTRARGLLRNAQQGDDKAQADEWLTKLEAGERENARAQRDLQDAQKCLTSAPEQAYKLLVKWYDNRWLPCRDDIAEAWRQVANRWQPDIEQELEDLLAAPEGYRNISQIEYLIQAIEQLQATGLDRWQERALPLCDAQKATEYEKKNDWQRAILEWEKAVIHASTQEKALYQVYLDRARLQQELAKAANRQDLSALLALESKYPHSIEVQRYLAEYYLRDDQDENARLKARVGLAMLATIEQGGDHRKALETVQGEVDVRLEIKEKKDQVERRLSPGRSVKEHDEAVQQADEIIRGYPKYKNKLNAWWDELKQRRVSKLEQELTQLENSNIDILGQIEVVAKLLCLDAGHPAARPKIQKMHGLIADLEKKVQQVEKDANGYQFSPDDQSLDKHTKCVDGLLDRARAIMQVVQRFGSLVNGSPQNSETFQELIQTLESRSNGLKQVQSEYKRCLSSIDVGKASGQWEVAQQALIEITRLGYGQHRSTEHLKRLLKTEQATRDRLETHKKHVEQFWTQERFKEALTDLDALEQGDEIGQYGLSSALVLNGSDASRPLARGVKKARSLILRWYIQAIQMEIWSKGIGAWYNWPQEQQQAQSHIDEADFKTAMEKCHQVVGSLTDDELAEWLRQADKTPRLELTGSLTRDELDQLLQTVQASLEVQNVVNVTSPQEVSLQQAIAYLSKPPVSPERLFSQAAKTIWQNATNRKNQAEQVLDQVRQFESKARQTSVQWDDAYAELTAAWGQYCALPDPSSLTDAWARLMKRNEIKDVKERLRLSLDRCKRLCPQHSTVQRIDKMFTGT